MANLLTQSNIDQNNVPRLLTETEIEDILSAVPPVASALDQVGESIREQLMLAIREQLMENPMTPLGIGRQKMKLEINLHLQKLKWDQWLVRMLQKQLAKPPPSQH